MKNKLKNRITKVKLSRNFKSANLSQVVGRSDKHKYQRNCAFSLKRKSTVWDKRKDKTMALDTPANLAESDKGSFCNQRKWSEFCYGEFINHY